MDSKTRWIDTMAWFLQRQSTDKNAEEDELEPGKKRQKVEEKKKPVVQDSSEESFSENDDDDSFDSDFD